MTRHSDAPTLIDRSYAKYELQTALLDGLFISARKERADDLAMRTMTKLYDMDDEEKRSHKGAVYVAITAPVSLSVQAESVLLAVLKLTGSEGERIAPNSEKPTADLGGDAKSKTIGVVSTTERALLREAGLDPSKKGYSQLRRYLQQLSNVRISYQNKVSNWSGTSWFIEHDCNADGRLAVRVNWRLTGAIFGEYYHAVVDLDERRALKSAPGKILHRWLSAHVWAGKSAYLNYTTLSRHIWPQTCNRMQEHRLRTELLPLVNDLPYWRVEMGQTRALISHLRKPKAQKVRNSRPRSAE